MGLMSRELEKHGKAIVERPTHPNPKDRKGMYMMARAAIRKVPVMSATQCQTHAQSRVRPLLSDLAPKLDICAK